MWFGCRRLRLCLLLLLLLLLFGLALGFFCCEALVEVGGWDAVGSEHFDGLECRVWIVVMEGMFLLTAVGKKNS